MAIRYSISNWTSWGVTQTLVVPVFTMPKLLRRADVAHVCASFQPKDDPGCWDMALGYSISVSTFWVGTQTLDVPVFTLAKVLRRMLCMCVQVFRPRWSRFLRYGHPLLNIQFNLMGWDPNTSCTGFYHTKSVQDDVEHVCMCVQVFRAQIIQVSEIWPSVTQSPVQPNWWDHNTSCRRFYFSKTARADVAHVCASFQPLDDPHLWGMAIGYSIACST